LAQLYKQDERGVLRMAFTPPRSEGRAGDRRVEPAAFYKGSLLRLWLCDSATLFIHCVESVPRLGKKLLRVLGRSMSANA